MALQIRRGTNAERLTITPESGEPIWTTDTKELYVGDGSTAGGINIGGASPSGDSDQALFTTSTVRFERVNIYSTGNYISTSSNDLQIQAATNLLLKSTNGGVYITDSFTGVGRIHVDRIQADNITNNIIFEDTSENIIFDISPSTATFYQPVVATTATITRHIIPNVGEIKGQDTGWPFLENTATIFTIDTAIHKSARLQIAMSATLGLDTHIERLQMDLLSNGTDAYNAQSAVLSTTSTGICSYSAVMSGTNILVKAELLDPVNFIGSSIKVMGELVNSV